MPDAPPREGPEARPDWWGRNWLLVVLGRAAQVLLVLSVLHLVLVIGWWGMNLFGALRFGGFRFTYLGVAFLPLFEIFCCGCLYALTVIAMRLDRTQSE